MDNILFWGILIMSFFIGLLFLPFLLWRFCFFSSLWSGNPGERNKARRTAVKVVILSVAAIAALWVVIRLQTEIDSHIGNAGRYATRTDRTIQLHPSEITFEVPQDWIDWDRQFHNNFHLSHRELRHVRTASGEWDTEYARVVNAGLPFEHCAAHVGGEGWGSEGASFGDLQVRAYVTDLSVRAVLKRIHGPAFEEAKKIAGGEGGLAGAYISMTTEAEWQHAFISYPLWYGDYGGNAVIDFYARDVGPYRLVLVFMGWGPEGEKSSILHSVFIPGKTR